MSLVFFTQFYLAFNGHGLKKPKNGRALGNLHRITKGFARKNVLVFWAVILSKEDSNTSPDFKLFMNKYIQSQIPNTILGSIMYNIYIT